MNTSKSSCLIKISVTDQIFDPWAQLSSNEPLGTGLGDKKEVGATSVFVGTMRDFNQGDSVSAMHLEHYPGMTEASLEKICDVASEKWEIRAAQVVHRVGDILPGEPIVLVAVQSSHRDAAFAACRYIIDELKHQAPFWKKEQITGGSRWVDAS